MDYSSLFASGFRAISTRHRRSSSAMDSLSPTSPDFHSVPFSQRRDSSLKLIISPYKRRASGQHTGENEGTEKSIADLASSAWDSPTLPVHPVSCLHPHDDADSGEASPLDKFSSHFTPSSFTASQKVALSPINGSAHQKRRSRRGSVGDSFLSFSPADSLTHTYPQRPPPPPPAPNTPASHRSMTTSATSRRRTRRHTVVLSSHGEKKSWMSGPLPPLPPLPSLYSKGRREEGTPGKDEESMEDWRSVIDDLLENENSLTL
ncbi:hypothetical protein EIP91_004759 [Steccherinum ochraceum]|uniref:Uncharacterized protein n=1 Tax=Steccherinum ochraceum TaxID=92696 RepID=A0A4R0RGL6_9APHY|nr:hypothetical protein EIP91_004759 [Steccherinum ochraceum]